VKSSPSLDTGLFTMSFLAATMLIVVGVMQDAASSEPSKASSEPTINPMSHSSSKPLSGARHAPASTHPLSRRTPLSHMRTSFTEGCLLGASYSIDSSSEPSKTPGTKHRQAPPSRRKRNNNNIIDSLLRAVEVPFFTPSSPRQKAATRASSLDLAAKK
jgi:hypothetical protein